MTALEELLRQGTARIEQMEEQQLLELCKAQVHSLSCLLVDSVSSSAFLLVLLFRFLNFIVL